MVMDYDDNAQITVNLMMSHNKTYSSSCGLSLNQGKCSIMTIHDQGSHLEWQVRREKRRK